MISISVITNCEFFYIPSPSQQQKKICQPIMTKTDDETYDETAVKPISKCLAHSKNPEFEPSIDSEEIMDY